MKGRKAPWICPNEDCMTVNRSDSLVCLMCREERPDDTPKEEKEVGHGHVKARKDGVTAKCGGPGVCSTCDREFVLQYQAQRMMMLHALRRVKLRLHFVGTPAENLWEATPGRWVPDWRYEIACIEEALHGTQHMLSPSPTDTKPRHHFAQRENAKADGVVDLGFMQVPAWLIEAADQISDYMDRQGDHSWKICGIQKRID